MLYNCPFVFSSVFFPLPHSSDGTGVHICNIWQRGMLLLFLWQILVFIFGFFFVYKSFVQLQSKIKRKFVLKYNILKMKNSAKTVSKTLGRPSYLQ